MEHNGWYLSLSSLSKKDREWITMDSISHILPSLARTESWEDLGLPPPPPLLVISLSPVPYLSPLECERCLCGGESYSSFFYLLNLTQLSCKAVLFVSYFVYR